MNQCGKCNKQYEYNKELRKKGYTKNKCNTCQVSESRTRSKMRSVEYKGGSCQICGYNKCIQALCFHHVVPSTKSFGIGSKGSSVAWEKLKIELDKCILLCHNCHCEVHAGLHTL